MGSMVEAIRQRISVRTYAERPIEEDKKQAIVDLLRANTEGPFGQTVRLALIDFAEMEREEVRRLGTYGVIRGARLYIVSAVKEGRGAMEDLGYCFEKVILGATSLGLGTCWIGAFNEEEVRNILLVPEEVKIVALTPVGYPAREPMIRPRKPLDEIIMHERWEEK